MGRQEFILVIVLSAAASWLGGYLVHWLLHKFGVMDVPNMRSSHDRPVVRGGGLAILLVLFAWFGVKGPEAMYGGWRLAVGLALVAGVSFFDDLRPLAFWLRLLVHGAAAILILSGLSLSAFPDREYLRWGILIVAWFWIVGYTNAFNFMDGINGLALMHALITCVFGAIFCQLKAGGEAEARMESLIFLQVVLAAAVAGFLPHNFPSARMFLGDVGSVSIGLLLTILVVAVWNLAGWKAGIALGALHLNFLMDTMITMTRRAVRRERVHEAHREHFYQRLNQAGKSHAQVTGFETALQVAAGVLLVLTFRQSFQVLLGAILGIVIGWLIFFLYCERQFRLRLKTGA